MLKKLLRRFTTRTSQSLLICDQAIKWNFRLDKHDQLIVGAEKLGYDVTVCAEITERLAIMLLPVARKVLRENGVTECS